MGKLVVQQFVSADGFAANDQNQFTLLGASTYRMFAGYWPTPAADGELVGPRINALPKYVFSRSLTSAPWGDYAAATIESGDAPQAVRRLKDEIRGDLNLWGSLSLTHDLLQARAVDVVRLVVLPVAIGSGRGVFPTESQASRLQLLGSETFDGILVAVDYAVDGDG